MITLLLILTFWQFHYLAATDCIVGEWSLWGTCNSKCSIGSIFRSRVILQKASNIFAKRCPNLSEEKSCGTEKNGCQDFCEESTGQCLCFSGYMLKADRKSCTDVNECLPNEKKGPCSNKCTNLQGGYQCSCPEGLYLQDDSHSCGKRKTYHVCISDGIHKYDNNKCVCKNKLHGLDCDRDENRCSSKFICRNTEYCLKFIKAPNRCVSKDEQIPILIPMSPENYVDGTTKYSIEQYLNAVLERKTNGEKFEAWKLSDKQGKLNENFNKYYSEAVSSIDVLDKHVLVNYAVLELPFYRALKYHQVCPLLQNTNMQCLSMADCDILKKTSLNCPRVNKSHQNLNESGSKSWLLGTIVGIVIFVIIVVLSVFVIWLRRRGENHNTDYTAPQTQLVQDEHHNTFNVLYGREDDEPTSPLYESIDNLKTCLVEDPHDDANNGACLKSNVMPANYDVPKSKNSKEENVVLVVDIPEPRYASPPTLSRR